MVFVIWPNYNSPEVAYRGVSGLKYACTRLKSDTAGSSTLSDDTLKLVTHLLLCAHHSPTLVIPSVCHTAISWKSSTIWSNALRTLFWNEKEPLLNDSDLSKAIRTFGFALTRETYVSTLGRLQGTLLTICVGSSMLYALRPTIKVGSNCFRPSRPYWDEPRGPRSKQPPSGWTKRG